MKTLRLLSFICSLTLLAGCGIFVEESNDDNDSKTNSDTATDTNTTSGDANSSPDTTQVVPPVSPSDSVTTDAAKTNAERVAGLYPALFTSGDSVIPASISIRADSTNDITVTVDIDDGTSRTYSFMLTRIGSSIQSSESAPSAVAGLRFVYDMDSELVVLEDEANDVVITSM